MYYEWKAPADFPWELFCVCAKAYSMAAVGLASALPKSGGSIHKSAVYQKFTVSFGVSFFIRNFATGKIKMYLTRPNKTVSGLFVQPLQYI